MAVTVDINCDMGESFGAWNMGDDAGMMDIITSANVACGFHGGDAQVMRLTAERAKAKGVSIGAHPGFDDIRGFGRRRIVGDTMAEIENMIAYQIGALQAVAALAGHRVTHVKPHGAMGNMCNEDDDLALAVGRAIKGVDASLVYVTLHGLPTDRAAEKLGLTPAREFFADRTYEDSGHLTSRKKPGSVIHDVELAATRAVSAVREQAYQSVTGKRIAAPIDTICVHGDGKTAVAMARAVRAGLEAAGIKIAPFRRA